jgi:hypothetical protein
MSTVSFKRSANINEIPILDGQLVFDETHNKIYMDNGTERLQYGGDVGLIEDKSYATSNNTFSAIGSLNLFTQKLSVIDNKDSALAVTEQYTPVGCLAFQSVIGNANYSTIGNTISDSLVTLKNNIASVNGQLTANSHAMYMDYHNGKYGVNTSSTRGADTFIPFSPVITSSVTIGLRGTEGHINQDYGGIMRDGLSSIFTWTDTAKCKLKSYTLSGATVSHSGNTYTFTASKESDPSGYFSQKGQWYGLDVSASVTITFTVEA